MTEELKNMLVAKIVAVHLFAYQNNVERRTHPGFWTMPEIRGIYVDMNIGLSGDTAQWVVDLSRVNMHQHNIIDVYHNREDGSYSDYTEVKIDDAAALLSLDVSSLLEKYHSRMTPEKIRAVQENYKRLDLLDAEYAERRHQLWEAGKKIIEEAMP